MYGATKVLRRILYLTLNGAGNVKEAPLSEIRGYS